MKPSWLGRSISHRVTAILAVITLLGAVLTTLAVSRVVEHEMDEVLDQGLRESADLIHNIMVRSPSASLIADAQQPRNSYEEHLVWQVVDLDSKAVVSRSSLAPDQPMATGISQDLFDVDSQRPGEHWRVITLPLETAVTATETVVDRPSARLMLLVAQSHDERVEARTEATQFAGLTSLLSALFTVALMFALVRLELQRLNRLSQALASYDPMDSGAHLPKPDRQELATITQAIEQLGRRLAQRVVSEQAFTAHAAHALRTPLAGLDAQLALAQRQATDDESRARLTAARSATKRLTAVMQALLAMFRTGIEPKRTLTDLAQLLPGMAPPGLQVQVEGPSVDVDPDLMAAVFMNLLDNAQRHGASRVQVQAQAQAAQWVVEVTDNGLGCDAETVRRLQAALDSQAYGADRAIKGLGLVLADLVMRGHGGRVRLSPEGDQRPAPAESVGFSLAMEWPRAVD